MKKLLLLISLLASANSFAEIYKWVDKDGQVHFGDSMPADATPEEMDLKVNSHTGISFGTALTNSNKVIMYSTSWCGYAKRQSCISLQIISILLSTILRRAYLPK